MIEFKALESSDFNGNYVLRPDSFTGTIPSYKKLVEIDDFSATPDSDLNLFLVCKELKCRDSKIERLNNLPYGWDGRKASPLASSLIEKAKRFYLCIIRNTYKETEMPAIVPGTNNCIAFVWSMYYPRKELEFWVYNNDDFYAEWLLTIGENEEEGFIKTEHEFLEILRNFQES